MQVDQLSHQVGKWALVSLDKDEPNGAIADKIAVTGRSSHDRQCVWIDKELLEENKGVVFTCVINGEMC